MTATKSKRIDWIDIAKMLAMACVIIGHTAVTGTPSSIVGWAMYSFHMPLFFILAGYTFKPKPQKIMLASSAKRLLVPYLLILATTAIAQCFNGTLIASWSEAGTLLLNAVVGSSDPTNSLITLPGVSMAWFLLTMFVARMILNFLMLQFERHRLSCLGQNIIVAVVFAAGWAIGPGLGVILPLDLDVALVATGFMWMGHLLRENHFMERLSQPSSVWPLIMAVFLWSLGAAASLLFKQLVPDTHLSLDISNRRGGLFPLSILIALAGSLAVMLAAERLGGLAHSTRPALVKFEQACAHLGQWSMAAYVLHYFEGIVIPWQTYAALGMEAFLLATLLRLGLVAGLTYLFKTV